MSEVKKGDFTIRRYKDGRINVIQNYKPGLFGYSSGSGKNRNAYMFYPKGTPYKTVGGDIKKEPKNIYKMHVATGFRGKRGDLVFERKTYHFSGYY